MVVRKLVDEKGRFEIFPNGHSRFMTKSARNKIGSASVPEPAGDYGWGKDVVTLRLRALPGKSIPEIYEGDQISTASPNKEFRVLEIFWGSKSYINLLVDGSIARYPISSCPVRSWLNVQSSIPETLLGTNCTPILSSGRILLVTKGSPVAHVSGTNFTNVVTYPFMAMRPKDRVGVQFVPSKVPHLEGWTPSH